MALALVLAAVLAGCSGATPVCMPDGQVGCACTANDSRPCYDSMGAAGLQFCGTGNVWSACLPFSDDVPPSDAASATTDVVIPDFGGSGG